MVKFSQILTIFFVLWAVTGCTHPTSGPSLAVEIQQNVDNRSSLSCDDVEAHYRVAQGVRTGLELQKYRKSILRELAGRAAPAMGLGEARTFSGRAAGLLRQELSRRCPQHKVTGKEDIVYIPS